MLIIHPKNCVRAYRGRGVQASANALRTGRGGSKIENFLRTYFMDGLKPQIKIRTFTIVLILIKNTVKTLTKRSIKYALKTFHLICVVV